ncbi:hypothetical protein IFR05_000345 [Cadophora sp. M221]|nr:hypothetical protein IFR05_000345 [Cadophora sp. M221]
MTPGDVVNDEASEPLLTSIESIPASEAVPDESWTKVCCFGVMVLVSMSYQFSEAPLLQLYANAICKEFQNPVTFPNIFSEDSHCDTDAIPVQKKLASVTSKQVNFDTALAIIASVYMPSLLRKWGIRRMLQLNLLFHVLGQLWIYLVLGTQLFPVELTWASSLTLAVASGPYMRMEMLFMVLALVALEDERFSTFTLGQMVVLVPDFLAKGISASLMDRCIWYPLFLGLLCSTVAVVALFWHMPIEPVEPQPNEIHPKSTSILEQFMVTLKLFFFTPTNFFLILTFSFTNVFGQLMSGSTLLQVLTRKFGMSLKYASVLQSLSNLVNLPPLAVMYYFPKHWDTLNLKAG